VRILVGVGAPALLLLTALFALYFGKTPPCIFYEATGLYCVGCGTGRALLSLLHGELYAAFRYQPLLIPLLPLIAYCLLKYYLACVLSRDLLPLPRIRARFFGIAILVLILSYWILRNIPAFPFCYLAPTDV
jgi:hypothetical protein